MLRPLLALLALASLALVAAPASAGLASDAVKAVQCSTIGAPEMAQQGLETSLVGLGIARDAAMQSALLAGDAAQGGVELRADPVPLTQTAIAALGQGALDLGRVALGGSGPVPGPSLVSCLL